VLRAQERRAAHRQRASAAMLLFGAATAVVVLVAGGAFAGSRLVTSGCSFGALRPIELGEDSFVFAANGSRLGAIPSAMHREALPLWKLSPWLAKATVAVEDRRYYQHGGLDYLGILRAAIADLKAGRIVEGGSTIEQELARNLYIGHADKTLDRKLREACLATQISKRWSKQKILATYLNVVYYGQHANGAEAAAQIYFSRSARRLGLVQAALLAGLPQSPSRYNPLVHPKLARARRNVVLRAMRDTGAITPATYRAAIKRPLFLKPGARYTRIDHPSFVSYVEQVLTRRYGAKTVRDGGLRVRTTLDPRLQLLAVRAIKGVLREPTDPAAALVALDPRSGAIRALMAYRPGKGTLQFNLATQGRRQAGSSFKPFTLVAALQQGFALSSGFAGPPSLTIQDPLCETGTTRWEVHNYADESAGYMPLRDALAHSVNTIFAQLVEQVGPEKVVNVAHAMGISSKLEPVCSIALGSQSVSPLEMATAYGTFASRGIYHAPEPIASVKAPGGKTLFSFEPKGKRVVQQNVIDQVVEALQGVVDHGTGVAAQIGRPVAGKTGTTESSQDAWFCGFTPQLVTCVWIGYPQAEIPMSYVEGVAGVTGGTLPARIWHDFMGPALEGKPVLDFAVPVEQAPTRTSTTHYYYSSPYSTTTTTTTTTPAAPAKPKSKPRTQAPAPPPTETAPAPEPPPPTTPEPPPPTDTTATTPTQTTP
ncbi:MAG: penicillin-binding protein, partial [Gaiellaceae bacterium]|nr:penicillin-binding protein [Gaiellaceae bacterium]